jgi:hypothetical protein
MVMIGGMLVLDSGGRRNTSQRVLNIVRRTLRDKACGARESSEALRPTAGVTDAPDRPVDPRVESLSVPARGAEVKVPTAARYRTARPLTVSIAPLAAQTLRARKYVVPAMKARIPVWATSRQVPVAWKTIAPDAINIAHRM